MSESTSSSVTGSMSSYASGGSSVADTADARAWNEMSQDREEDELASDVIDANRTLEDAVFASLYTLSKNRRGTDLRWTTARVVLEALQMFLVVFNTNLAWNIDVNSWIWKATSWTLIRLIVLPMGYDSYIAIFYLISAVVVVTITLTVYLSVAFKEENNSNIWVKRLTAGLQFLSLILFCVFWACILDHMVFLVNCDWQNFSKSAGAAHVAFTDHNCMAMPHLAHMAFAAFMTVLHSAATLCMACSDCDLNPLTRNHLASPVGLAHFRIMALKVALVLVSVILSALGGKTQAVLMLIIVVCILYFMLFMTPYYYELINYSWVGIWMGILYTVILLVNLNYTMDNKNFDQVDAYRKQMTMGVLYGIFPLLLFGAGVSYVYMRYRRRPLVKFTTAEAVDENLTVLKDVYRFRSVFEAEYLLRVVRKWDSDGIPDPSAVALGEFMMKCAMARLPNQPTLMCLYSNFILESRKDAQAARTQLQLAAKNSPGMIERYLIYVSQKYAARLKSDSDALDLIGYVEYQRAYRACVRMHQLALQGQRQLWQSLLRSNISYKELQDCFFYMVKTQEKAAVIYKRVLERYPANGKLLKVYGRFLEFVGNDPWSAKRFYSEALKQGMEESILSLAASSTDVDINLKLTTLLGTVNEKTDGIIIINAVGSIMMVNAALSRMFGYEKGELDGKNVAALMPQPYSARHATYLQKYNSTGQAKSIGTLRQLVALNKDRSVFPISLVVQKLSGIGADNIFMGVIRPTQSEDHSVVKVWVTPTGIVLCADEHFRDWFGVASKMVVGRNVGTLTTDSEALNSFVIKCASMSVEELAANPPRIRAKLLHKYLAAVDAEVTIEVGGSDGQRIYMLSLRCIADTLAVMVTDTKGRIQFATTQMAAMVGYTIKAMSAGMNLNLLLPPPYAQLHTSLMKDLSHQAPPNSCRAGAVVHLMHANGSKIPVTLQISQHDDGDHTQHVVKVLPANAAQLLDRQRVELQLNHKGVVLSINEGASKIVFGFNPEDLVGRPLGSFLNLFDDWKQKFGDDESLLVMLGMRAEQNMDVTYRAGVHPPFSDAEMVKGYVRNEESEAKRSTLLGALQSRHKEVPAIITLKMNSAAHEAILALNGASGTTATDAESTPVLTLGLWRAEGLTSVVEVDNSLNIVRAETTTGLLFGVPTNSLIRRSFKTLVGMSPSSTADDLLSTGSNKKSMLKQGASWKIGPIRQVDAKHLDEGAMRMQIQAVTKDGKTANRLLILIRVLNSTTGSLLPLVALKTAGAANASGMAAARQLLEKLESGSDRDEDDAGEKRADTPDLHDKLDSRLRVQQWMSNSMTKREEGAEEESAPPRRGRRRSGPGGRSSDGDEGAGRKPGRGDRRDMDESEAVVEVRVGGRGGKMQEGGGKGSALEPGGGGGGDDAGSEHAGSVASGSQSGGSEALDATSVASDAEEELVVDWRRAKRLKKLLHMMTSSAAQTATTRFRKQNWLLVMLLVLAHTAFFAVLFSEIDGRFQVVREVGDMAEAVEHSQMIATLSNMIQKCADPSISHMPVCKQELLDQYVGTMQNNYNILKHNHQRLYLGYNELRQFAEPRLMQYWTRHLLPEVIWFANRHNQSQVLVPGNNTLWSMGNRYLQFSQDVTFNAPILKHKLLNTSYWQYIYNNGPESLFRGYCWSLDVYMDYAWARLGTLSSVVLILMIIEALVIQLGICIYGFFQLMSANREAMKRFSVFLALPSATVRSMASTQLAVDDDDKVMDDDEMEAINNAAAAGLAAEAENAANGKEAGETKSKSVRMALAAGDDDDDEEGAYSKSKKSRSKKKSSAASESTRADDTGKVKVEKRKKTWLQKIDKFLFGWANVTFKINGKKMIPHNEIIWKFTLPLLAWVGAVLIIYGISLQMLAGLQGPLASLNAAARVRSRVARVRLMGSILGFAEVGDTLQRSYRTKLMDELKLMKFEYDALMYGGRIDTVAENLVYDVRSPAAAFANQDFSNIFFLTTGCLRADQSKCYPESSTYYHITHQGLDAMVYRFIDEMTVFANLPDNMAFPNHTSYDYITYVAANDMYEGLQRSSSLFVTFTISRFEQVKTMHIILLVCSLMVGIGYIWKLYWPYVSKLRAESKAMAGILSQLPAEVDIEGHIKTHVLGIKKDANNTTSMRAGDPAAGAGAMGPGAMPMHMPVGLLPPPGGNVIPGGYGAGGPPGMAYGGGYGGGGGGAGYPGPYGNQGGYGGPRGGYGRDAGGDDSRGRASDDE